MQSKPKKCHPRNPQTLNNNLEKETEPFLLETEVFIWLSTLFKEEPRPTLIYSNFTFSNTSKGFAAPVKEAVFPTRCRLTRLILKISHLGIRKTKNFQSFSFLFFAQSQKLIIIFQIEYAIFKCSFKKNFALFNHFFQLFFFFFGLSKWLSFAHLKFFKIPAKE